MKKTFNDRSRTYHEMEKYVKPKFKIHIVNQILN